MRESFASLRASLRGVFLMASSRFRLYGFRDSKELVRSVLADSVFARRNDYFLLFECLKRLGEDIRVTVKDAKAYFVWRVKVEDVFFLPSFETFRRRRAEIQNVDGEFLPRESVLFARDRRECLIRDYYRGFCSGEGSYDIINELEEW